MGVFKPKNEEPYGHLNPKWTKWIHKNLFPCCFGRSCLIPNLGYISEAAASYLDRRLQLNVCPRTEIVELASPSFFYSLKDRRAHRRGVPLPPKMGSFQLFLKGYKDATTFFKEGYDKVAAAETASDNYNSRSSSFEAAPSRRSASHPLNWPEKTKKDFQMGFERLVVLDYLTRNTDRGSDNWMIRYNPQIVAKYNHASAARPTSMSSEGTVVDMSKFINNAGGGGTSGQGCDASLTSTTTPLLLSDSIDKNMATLSAGEEIQHHLLPYHHESSSSSTLTPSDFNISKNTPSSNPVSYSPSAESLLSVDYNNIEVTIHVSAIDNGLAFPYKHPDRWRSYPYGWSALPISRLPFSSSTRKQVLHLLTSQEWWNETRAGLEKLFRLDPDFNDAMWRKQRAIIRGQVCVLERAACLYEDILT